MHPRIFAERNSKAQNELVENAASLVKALNLDPDLVSALNAPMRAEPKIKFLYQTEAIVSILKAAISSTPKPSKPKKAKPENPDQVGDPSDPAESQEEEGK